MTIHLIRTGVLCGLCVFCAHQALAQQYTVTDLGTLGGTFSLPHAINASGQVVGMSNLSQSFTPMHAFLWTDGDMQDLGVLPGQDSSQATAINDRGQIVGRSWSLAADQPFLWTADTGMTALPFSGSAAGINAQGHVVGWLGGYPSEAFLFRDGEVLRLGRWGANGVSDDDRVVGDGPNGGARLWDAAGPHDLDAEGPSSTAHAISTDGLVVAGESTRGGSGSYPKHAVLWTPYGLSDLGTLPRGDWARARAISGSLIVGGSTTATWGNDWHAFLYDTNGPGYPVDLNDLIPTNSGWVLREATGINAAGQVVGYGAVNGEQHAFLLTPVQTTTR